MGQDLLSFFASGSDPSVWIISKFLMAFIGGTASVYIKNTVLLRPGDAKINFFWDGLLYSIYSSFGGICLLDPANMYNAFGAGVIGVQQSLP